MLTLVITLFALNTLAKSSIVSIISSVIVDLPLAVSPAIPTEAERFSSPVKNLVSFLIASGLYANKTGVEELISSSNILNNCLSIEFISIIGEETYLLKKLCD